MPAKGLDYEQMEELLIKITGGQVTIVEIKPYHPHRYSRAVAEPRKPTKEKYVLKVFFFLSKHFKKKSL